MKNTKLIFIGMLAVVLAFGLVFTSCEGPTGATGPAGANGSNGSGGGGNGDLNNEAANLATFGVAFSNPEHTSIGREAVYEDTVVTSYNVIGISPGDGLLTVEKKNSSVTFPYSSADFADLASLTTFVNRVSNLISTLGVRTSLVSAPGDETANPKKLIQFKGDTRSEFEITSVGTDTGIATFFDTADTDLFPGNRVRNRNIVSEKADYWTFTVKTAVNSNSIVDIKYGDKTLTTLTAVSSANAVATAIRGNEENGITFTFDGGTPGNGVKVQATNGRALAATEILPTISFNTDYAAWGYRVYARKIVKYKPAVDEAVAAAKAYVTGKDIEAASTLEATDKITIQVDYKNPATSVVTAYKDTIVFKAAPSGDNSTDILLQINAGLYKTKPYLATPNGATKDADKKLHIEALNVGTGYVVTASDFDGGFTKTAGVNAIDAEGEIAEQWFIGVDGGFPATGLNPTKASKVSFSGGAVPVSVSIQIAAASVEATILQRINETLNNSQPNAPSPEPKYIEDFKADYDLGTVGLIPLFDPETGDADGSAQGFIITDKRLVLSPFTVIPAIGN